MSSCSRVLFLLLAGAVLTHRARADSTPSITLNLSPNVYTVGADGEITLRGFFTSSSAARFNYEQEFLFGLTSASPHLGIVAGSILNSVDFNPPIGNVFFQDAIGGGGFLGPTEVTGPTIAGVFDLRTFLMPIGTPPGEYHYSYGVAFGPFGQSVFDQSLTVDVVPEPFGLALMATGFAAALLLFRRGRLVARF